jgi:hypothetical protein
VKYLLQADWERLVKNAERYEAVVAIVWESEEAGANAFRGLTRAEFDALADAEIERQADAPRAGGGCVCRCGLEYRNHPRGGPIGYDGEQFLNRLCDGRLVKL